MSELMSARNSKRNFRWQLLTTVSALALFAAAYGSEECKAADQDADHPTIWIELGGQMEHINGQGDAFAPEFLATNPDSPVLQPTTPLQAQRPGLFSFAEEGKISIQPENSDWIFSVGVNYGRSSNFKHVDHQTNKTSYRVYKYGVPVGNQNPNSVADFADTHIHHRESHAILDFSVGKDVGLGMFGRDGSSALSLGIRFAQFASQATFDVRARPDLRIEILPLPTFPATLHLPYFHTYHATGQASRSFHGVGPSLSWSGSAPFAGNQQGSEITVDWGANVALLFGRQKARVGHHETAHYESPLAAFRNTNLYPVVYQHSGGHSTDRSVVVPNVGGFAGVSIRRANAKISLGYRADFFFGAIDAGIDTPNRTTIGFYGPFATISVGLGE